MEFAMSLLCLIPERKKYGGGEAGQQLQNFSVMMGQNFL